MLKKLAISLLLVVFLLLLVFLLDLGQDPGYLLIAWRNTTFETSLVAAVLAIAVLFLLLRLLIKLLVWLDPRRLLRRFRPAAKDDSHTRSRTTRGLIGFVRGDWDTACRELQLSFNEEETTVANYLAAAQAAFALGREEDWRSFLDKAGKRYPGALSLIREARTELLLKNGQPDQARALLEQLERTSSGGSQLLALRKRVYLELEDWDKLESLLPELRQQEFLSEEEGEQWERRVFTGRLTRLADRATDAGEDKEEVIAELMDFWDDAPHRYHKDLDLITGFVSRLVKAGAAEEAARVIESTLPGNWHDPLIEIYGMESLGNNEAQLIHAEDWLRGRPNNSELLLALGRIAMRNRAWLSAREYFEMSCRLNPGAAVHGELARLLVNLGDEAGASLHLGMYLNSIDSGLAELPMPEHRKTSAD